MRSIFLPGFGPLPSRGRTKPPQTVPFDARKELVSGACLVGFAGLGQLNTGQIYFAQVNFDLVRQLPVSTVRCPAQTAPRAVDSALALALALGTASARIRSSTLHQPRSILCHRLCRAPIGDVPGSDPTARPPCVCTSALLLRRRHIRFPLGTSFHPRRFEKAQARSGPASGPASGPSPGTTKPNPAMAQATSQLSAPCGWNSNTQPLAPASIGPRKTPRPPRRPLAHVPPCHIWSRGFCQQRKLWTQLWLLAPVNIDRTSGGPTRPWLACPAHPLDHSRRQLVTTGPLPTARLVVWNSLQVPPIFGRERRLPASPPQLFPRKPPPRTKQASVPRARPQGRGTRNDDRDGHSQQHHHPRAPRG